MSSFIITTASGFEGKARAELRRLLGELSAESLFMKGNLLLEVELPEERVVAELQAAETEHIARVVPIHSRERISKDRGSLDTLSLAAADLNRIQASDTFVVKCNRRGDHDFTSMDVARAVGMHLEEQTGAEAMPPDTPTKIVSLEIYQDHAFVGVSPPETLLTKQIKKSRKYAPGTRPLNRAEHKLKEALKSFDIELRPTDRALDLGAAPGGWTKVLAARVAEVVAVDPAELHESVTALENVVHLRCRAEELLAREVERFDVIVNDMNIEPEDSASLMCAMEPLLKPGALAVMTMKFFTRSWARQIKAVTAILEERYTDIQVRHLPHNKQESTAVMRLKG